MFSTFKAISPTKSELLNDAIWTLFLSFFLLLKIFKAKSSKPKRMLFQRKKSSIFSENTQCNKATEDAPSPPSLSHAHIDQSASVGPSELLSIDLELILRFPRPCHVGPSKEFPTTLWRSRVASSIWTVSKICFSWPFSRHWSRISILCPPLPASLPAWSIFQRIFPWSDWTSMQFEDHQSSNPHPVHDTRSMQEMPDLPKKDVVKQQFQGAVRQVGNKPPLVHPKGFCKFPFRWPKKRCLDDLDSFSLWHGCHAAVFLAMADPHDASKNQRNSKGPKPSNDFPATCGNFHLVFAANTFSCVCKCLPTRKKNVWYPSQTQTARKPETSQDHAMLSKHWVQNDAKGRHQFLWSRYRTRWTRWTRWPLLLEPPEQTVGYEHELHWLNGKAVGPPNAGALMGISFYTFVLIALCHLVVNFKFHQFKQAEQTVYSFNFKKQRSFTGVNWNHSSECDCSKASRRPSFCRSAVSSERKAVVGVAATGARFRGGMEDMDMAGTRLDSIAVKRFALQFDYWVSPMFTISDRFNLYTFSKNSLGRSKRCQVPRGWSYT